MRAHEFINESKNNTYGLTLAKYSLPNTYVIPELQNQDFYEIYRFGLAIADVRGSKNNDNVQNQHRRDFQAESDWGENQVVTSFDPDIGNLIDAALSKINKHGKKLVSTEKSEELPNTDTTSPMKAFKGYKK
jgi:hypothetical protein